MEPVTLATINAFWPIISSVLGGITLFLWVEIKDQRKRIDDLARTMATQQQIAELEKRITESVGARMEGVENKLDLIFNALLKRSSDN